MSELIQKIENKYKNLKHDPNTFLKGLLHSKPITYWDYIQVDTLLSLQKTRTDFPDEYIFVVYHQVTELILALITHELKQIVDAKAPLAADRLEDKINRICRYVEVLDSSFSVMSQGMEYEQYNEFRLSLAPASGFQAVSFRIIEFYCTDLFNLIRPENKTETTASESIPDQIKLLYWQDAGMNRQTGARSLMLDLFEEKYLPMLIQNGEQLKGRNLNSIINKDLISDSLKSSLRRMDYLFNVKWPLSHLNTAESYLIASGHKTASTGMSDWQKYLHPAYQQRCFFPGVWTEEERANWGKFEIPQ
jgi:tryptophan 2,3-dioxygenase